MAKYRNVTRSRSKKVRVFDWQDGKCILCGKQMILVMGVNGVGVPALAATWEHFWPNGHGGTSQVQNMALSHRDCNAKRGNALPTEEHYVRQGLLILKYEEAMLYDRIIFCLAEMYRGGELYRLKELE